jgi:hypothetical protein
VKNTLDGVLVPHLILGLATIASATVLGALHVVDGATATAVVLAALGISSGVGAATQTTTKAAETVEHVTNGKAPAPPPAA